MPLVLADKWDLGPNPVREQAMTLSHHRHLRDRFVAIGVSKNLAGALAAQVSQWVSCSGPEWTVARLKMLKTGFLRRIAGEGYTLPFVATRVDALGPVPKGPFGVLWNDAQVSDTTSISRVLNALMVYSTFKSEEVTPTQWEKFHKSMTRPQPGSSELQQVLDLLTVPKWCRVDERIGLDKIEEFVVRHGYTPAYVSKAIDSFVESDTGMALWEEYPQYQTCFNTLAKPVDSRIRWDDMFGYHPPLNSVTTRDPVGRLGFTHEPGYKLRCYAAPNIVHQLAMSRLKAQLFTLLRRVRWDCTYDQTAGAEWVRAQLNQDRVVFSIDLSDATNNFPLDLQLKVLREIGCSRDDVELFHRLARAPWSSDHGGQPDTIRWTVGQPLGLGPSFPAFALTHGLLVWSIARRHQVTDAFRVLGDDIVIANEQVASDYIAAMESLGIPISRDKTLCSNQFAEFAGKLISRKGILAGLKWRNPSDRSFLDVVRLLGPRSLSLLTKRQRDVAAFIAVLPEPHGFGWNPLGIPWEKRQALAEAFNSLTPERQRTFHPLERRWNRVRRQLEQPYFKLSFTTPIPGGWWEAPVGKASEQTSREPTPVGSRRHLLSIAEITGTPLKLPESELSAGFLRELRARGFVALTSSSDPRGINPLEGLEWKIAKLRELTEQLGLPNPVSL